MNTVCWSVKDDPMFFFGKSGAKGGVLSGEATSDLESSSSTFGRIGYFSSNRIICVPWTARVAKMDWGCCPRFNMSFGSAKSWGPWLTKMGWFVDEIGLNDLMSLHPPQQKVQDQLVWLSHNTWNLSNFANTQSSKHAGDQGLSSRCEVSFARDKETWAMNSVRTVGLTWSGPMMFSCYWISTSFKWIDQTHELSNRSATFLIIILPSSTLSKQEMWMHVTFIIYKPWHVWMMPGVTPVGLVDVDIPLLPFSYGSWDWSPIAGGIKSYHPKGRVVWSCRTISEIGHVKMILAFFL